MDSFIERRGRGKGVESEKGGLREEEGKGGD